jgi:acyl-CoA synthetase (AMP-forming)/AMP-acid ligase II
MFARMDGLMMDRPLLIRDIAERAERIFPTREIVSRTHDDVERSTYGEVVRRARRVASSLQRLGVKPGDRVATFGWNSRRHLELYLALPSMGAVMHTLNIRLFEDELRYIVGHAGDKVIFLDASLADVMPRFDGVEHEVLMPDAPGARDGALDYEQLVSDGDEGFAFPDDLDERTAAALCYTSGTTGKPKGVLYSHRSTVLHSIGANQADALGLSQNDSVMPVVPMFHANAWGLPYAAATSGSRLVLPGPRMTPGDLGELIASEHVTFTAGVPTIWQGMLRLEPAPDLGSVREIVCGGSAVPEALIRGFEEKFGVPIVQAWGMTETSPVASVCRPGPDAPEDADERFRLRATQGRVVPLVDFTIDEDSGGELLVRGPWVAAAYYEDDSQKERFAGGWLRTGDVAQVVDGSFIKLVDRTKDLVKSGGEWISSVELENVVMAHPKVMEAAVVAVSDDKWGERPCACVVPCEGEQLDADELRSFLSERVAKWWVPDRIEFIDEVPKTAVGKFDKKVLRKRFAEEEATAGESAA